VVRVRGAGGGRVSIAGVACYRPGDRPHLFYTLLVYRRRRARGESGKGSGDPPPAAVIASDAVRRGDRGLTQML
jgi:putative transposase